MRPLRGIALKLASVVLFVIMGALIKATSDRIPAGQAMFSRAFFAIPVILAWLALRRELASGFRVVSPMGHVWRGLLGAMSMGLGFAALAYLPFPEVTALGYTAPLLTVIFAAIFLGEDVRAFRISMVVLGIVGVLIVLAPRLTLTRGDPGDTAQALGVMLVLSSAVFASLAQVTLRKLVQTETTSSIVFWLMVNVSLLSLVTLPFGWVMPTRAEAAMMVMSGVIGGVGQIFITSAYREADVSVIAPFDYASMLFALAIGYWIFGEVPTLAMLCGAALIILAGVLIIWRERRLGIERAKQRKAMTP